MKKVLLSTATALLLATSLNADTLGAEIGFATWNPELTGSIKGNNVLDSDIDVEKDLGFGSKETNSFFWVYFDHPVPFLPNIKLQKTSYSDSASKINSIIYDGKTYSGNIKTNLTLNQTDIISYYRLLDNWINFDLGVNLKVVDGNIKISAPSATDTNKDFGAIIPMLYAKARFDLPFSGLSFETDGSYVGYSGSKLSDFKAGIVYESSYGLGATAGIRKQNLTLDDIDNTNTNLDINGLYAGLFYHF
jgi:outer membrane protein